MPTVRGWFVLAGAGTLIGCGRLLGLPELYVLGATAIALEAGAFASVRLVRIHLEARRTIHPDRVPIGGACVAELDVHNPRPTRSPVVLLRDPVEQSSVEGRFLLPPLQPGQHESVAYLLPTERRGVFRAGPLLAEISDPFGLFSQTVRLGSRGRITVIPVVEELSPLPGASSGDGDAVLARSPLQGGPADEFSSLRPYEEGDDLRRVHWPSTARLGRLVVRQEEQASDGRMTVLVDLRRRVHSPASLEAALSASASIASASCHGPFRLIGTDGTDTRFGMGGAHLDRVLRGLAASRWTSQGDLVTSIASACRGAEAGTLVAITTSASTGTDLTRLSALRARFRLVVLVVVERRSQELATVARHMPPGVLLVRVPFGSPLRPRWEGAGAREHRTRPSEIWGTASRGSNDP